ncbi:SpoIIE family protein phosphatase [Streptomyces sp. NPDC004549]|uniref:SpoIIE family protein phosphatase n=1 Tax=Streptomyces sp. NPDC004549 TaxID=3154283 RepID=UPI0033BBA567
MPSENTMPTDHHRADGLPRGAPFELDGEGRVRGWSAEAEALLGYPPQAVEGRLVTELISIASGGTMMRHRDGRLIPCRLGLIPEITDEDSLVWSVRLADLTGDTQSERERAAFEALYTESPLGLFILGSDLRIVRLNEAAEGFQGITAEDTVGRRMSEVWPDASSCDAAEQAFQEVLRTGKPLTNFEKRCYPTDDDLHERIFDVSGFRLQDAEGNVLGVAEVSVDITTGRRAQERLQLLVDASTCVGTTLDILRTSRELADFVVPRVADGAAVDLVAEVLTGSDIPEGPLGPETTLRRMATACGETEAHAKEHGPGGADQAGFPIPSCRLLGEPRPVLVSDLKPSDPWPSDDPARNQSLIDAGVRSLMVLPLRARGTLLGLVSLYRWSRRPGPFEQEDLIVAEELANRVALCVDNARRYTRERNAARVLHQDMLPRTLQAQGALHIAHGYAPTGDTARWFDVIPLSGARVALAAGAVPAQGLGAAAAVGRLRSMVRVLAVLDTSPDELLARLDELAVAIDEEQASAHDPPTGGSPEPLAGATCVYGVYDPIEREFTVASAGHPPPLLIASDPAVNLADMATGPALGLSRERFPRTFLTVPPGTLITLHTPPPGSGDDETREAADALRQTLDASLDEHEAFQTAAEVLLPEGPAESAAILIARTRELPEAQVAVWELPADPAMVATARTLAKQQLSAWNLGPDVRFTTELVVSELVTNAFRYATEPVTLRLILDRDLTCEVADGSNAAPHLRHARTTDEGGRGLLLVASFVSRWGTRFAHQGGKTIWAEQQLTPA